ncbi:hypothetical protein ABE288_04720 [Bacillus salipaludis]|uniref:hypothetical protein n=1 Tax=Bacillus salipaludis TaxID=2547811 RepID=UPI003D23E0A1
MSIEYFLNAHIHLNLAIYYSMIGKFEQVKQSINITWFFAYIAIYVYAIWDSYRRTIDLNKTIQLAYKTTSRIQPFQFSTMEINTLEKKEPWVAFVWSFIMPGLGYFYLQRIPSILFTFFWWGLVLYFSKLNQGIFYSAIGDFEQAKSYMNVEWLLFVPSVYGFSMYNAYVMAVENNKIYKIEQSLFLKHKYQRQSFDEMFLTVKGV